MPVTPCMAAPLKVRALALSRPWKIRMPAYVPVEAGVRLTDPLPLSVIGPNVPPSVVPL